MNEDNVIRWFFIPTFKSFIMSLYQTSLPQERRRPDAGKIQRVARRHCQLMMVFVWGSCGALIAFLSLHGLGGERRSGGLRGKSAVLIDFHNY